MENPKQELNKYIEQRQKTHSHIYATTAYTIRQPASQPVKVNGKSVERKMEQMKKKVSGAPVAAE